MINLWTPVYIHVYYGLSLFFIRLHVLELATLQLINLTTKGHIFAYFKKIYSDTYG